MNKTEENIFPGVDSRAFEIVFQSEYKVSSDVETIYAPKNIIHRIRKFFKLSYKEKVIGYKHNIEKIKKWN